MPKQSRCIIEALDDLFFSPQSIWISRCCTTSLNHRECYYERCHKLNSGIFLLGQSKIPAPTPVRPKDKWPRNVPVPGRQINVYFVVCSP
jgi:hypothetical protein